MNNNSSQRRDTLDPSASARLAESAVAAMARCPAESLRHPHRGTGSVARARQTAMYLAHVAFGLSFTRIGICFGRDRTTVRHACALIEDGRDDPALEFGLSAVEAALVAMKQTLAWEIRR